MRLRLISTFTRVAAGVIALGSLVTPVSAEFTHRFTASDGEPFDHFGVSVGISGNTVVVGGDLDDEFGGQEAGAAYLFDATTGDEIVKLTADDAVAFDRFGSAVGISDSTAIVGANLHDVDGRSAGSAYLFDVTTGRQLHKLTADDASAFDRLGWSVAISDNIAVAGARSDGDLDTFSGAAYLFDVATGRQLHKLTAADAQPDDPDFFGWSVAVSGGRALVGAIGDDQAGPNSGAVYVFDVTTGQQVAKLTADDATVFDRFGTSVAVSGDTAIVGARTETSGGDFVGAAYVFDLATGDQIAKLVPGDQTSLDRFGWSVAIDGHIATVGAIQGTIDDGSQAGVAYLFDVTTGQPLARLTGGTFSDFGDNVGWSVGISGGTVVVGSPDDRDATGSVFLFDQGAVIPEPVTLSWLVVSSAAMFCRRRRRLWRSGG